MPEREHICPAVQANCQETRLRIPLLLLPWCPVLQPPNVAFAASLSVQCFVREVVVDPCERKRILMKAGRYFISLTKCHQSRECRCTMKCSKCNGRHHISLEESDRPCLYTQFNTTAEPALPPTSSVTNTNARVPVAKTHVHKIENPCATVEV